MTEGQLSSQLVRYLRTALPGAVVFKLADRFTAGIPDIAVTWGGRTAWLEVKLANSGGKFKSTGVQHLTARMLQKAGICYYVIYTVKPQYTRVVAPCHLNEWEGCYEARATGHDHGLVVSVLTMGPDPV